MRITLWVTVVSLCLPAALAFADDVQVIVGFHGNPDGSLFEKHGGKRGTDLSSLKAYAGSIPAGKLRALRNEPGVAYVEEDGVAHTTDTPNDPNWATWNVYDQGLIRCPEAWDVPATTTSGFSRGEGVRVAVLDTGAYTSHPDLSGKVDYKRNWTTKNSSDVGDKNGHGTHTAGTVGAKTNNGIGVASPGRDCRLSIGKVLANNGSGQYSWVAAGIDWAWSSTGGQARVISMSLGGTAPSTLLHTAVQNATLGGAIVVAAAGNSGSSTLEYPGAYSECIAVAAIDALTGHAASFTSYGAHVDVAAPGVDILSTTRFGGYGSKSGTSMATPHVAGVAALVLSTDLALSSGSVRARITGTQVPTGYTYPDGSAVTRIDAYNAVTSTLEGP